MKILATLGSLLLVGCGGLVVFQAPEPSSATFTVRRGTESPRTFQVGPEAMICSLSDDDYLDVVLYPTGDPSTMFRIQLGPAGSGRFLASGKTIAETTSLSCEEPCVSFSWVEPNFGAHSHRWSDDCELVLQEEDRGWRGTFGCRDMTGEPTSEVDGQFYCAGDAVRWGGGRPS